LNHAACGPEGFTCAVAAGDQELLGGLELGVGDFPVVRDETVGVGVGLFEEYELGAFLLELECPGVMGVDPGDDGVQRLLVPPRVVAVVGAEALLVGADADLDDLEGLGAGEADGVGWLADFLIFFALGNPSTFTVSADCPTPSPRGPVGLVSGLCNGVGHWVCRWVLTCVSINVCKGLLLVCVTK